MGSVTARIACLCLLLSPLVFLDSSGWGLFLFDVLCLLAGFLTILFWPQLGKGGLDLRQLSPWIALVVFVGLQLLPIFPAWLKFFSPATGRLYAETIWQIWPTVMMPVSIHPRETMTGLFHLVALVAFMVAVGRMLANWSDLNFLRCCSHCGFLWALTALAGTLLMFTPGGNAADFSADVAKARSLLLVWTIGFLPVLVAIYSGLRPNAAIRLRLTRPINYLKTRTVFPHLAAGEGLLLILMALAISGLPWLWLAGLGSWLTYRGFRSRQRIQRTVNFTLAGLICLWILFTAGFLSMAEAPLESSSEDRVMVSSTPALFGSGLNVQDNLPRTLDGGKDRNPITGGDELWRGLGIIGILVFLLPCIFVLRGSLPHKRSRTDSPLLHNLRAAGLSGLCWCLFFGFFMPGLGWPGFLAAVAFFLALTTLNAGKPGTGLSAAAIQRQGLVRWFKPTAILATVFCGSLLVVGLFQGADLLVGRQSPDYGAVSDLASRQAEFDRAAAVWATQTRWVPFESQAPLRLGRLLFQQGQIQEADHLILKALRRRPGNAETLFAAVVSSARVGRHKQVAVLLDSRVLHNLPSSQMTERLLLSLLTSDGQGETSARVARGVFEWNPDRSTRYVGLLVAAGYSLDEIFHLLPDQPEALLAYGGMALTFGELALAEQAYLRAVSPGISNKAQVYLQVAEYFRTADQTAQALSIARSGKEAFPRNVDLRQLVAELRSQMGYTRHLDTEYRPGGVSGNGPIRN